ncbi:M20/M25/M40 family metallo-hydrolase [Salirhabdus salicampi]|uniref:M20/M25/M40 family metallo-hydrolase n=1 Tax=Salirhabdus salicampi TaxID=476102 RepID=UPI0020C47D08|nr:M20/M25/M40 family metallo-hydrolase [Salirhabdus salicampi]MCP8616782.1 M20/M25/M40 family metallo-hydrolase [Salirhabdus salicampi]
MSWQTKKEMIDLLCSLVEYPSITGSEAEIAIVEYVYYLLSDKPYFQSYPQHVSLNPLQDGRQYLTALVKSDANVKDTVVLVSHIDVVDVEDYGSFKNLAFHPKALTNTLRQYDHLLPQDAKEDLATGEWLFGRGTMDMKAGLTLHLSLLEKAMNGEFQGNLLLLVVPDEEANSLGMIGALPRLQQLKEEENLSYEVCLNAEPMFRHYPGDTDFYMYTGSIGKVLPGFYCYGKETHAGEPFAGVNANVMSSYVNQEIELHESFIERVGKETTPPPVSLMNRDLKDEYSVQTPISAISMYNILFMEQTIEELTEKLLAGAKRAKKKIEHHYREKGEYYQQISQVSYSSPVNVSIWNYNELYEEAVKRHGEEEVLRRQRLLMENREQGDRDFSTLLVQDLAYLCKDLAPMIILFYSPPFYPAVSTTGLTRYREQCTTIQQAIASKYGVTLKTAEYFPGLSDLSFVGPVRSNLSLSHLKDNMPLHGKGYQLDEKAMKSVSMPVLNIGPYGKNAHQWTERLHLPYTFETLPNMLTDTVRVFFNKKLTNQ